MKNAKLVYSSSKANMNVTDDVEWFQRKLDQRMKVFKSVERECNEVAIRYDRAHKEVQRIERKLFWAKMRRKVVSLFSKKAGV